MASENRELTAKDACLIIKAAKDAGVRKLSFRGLECDFGAAPPMWPDVQAFDELTHPATAVAAHTENNKIIEQELSAKADMVAESVVDDPMLYEQLLTQDELIGDATDGAAEQETDT